MTSKYIRIPTLLVMKDHPNSNYDAVQDISYLMYQNRNFKEDNGDKSDIVSAFSYSIGKNNNI